MEYEVFQKKIATLAKQYFGNVKIHFDDDQSEGKYVAKLSNGYEFSRPYSDLSYTIRWGKNSRGGYNHQAMGVL